MEDNNKQKALEQAAAQVAEAEGKVRAAAAQEQLYKNQAWMQYQLALLQLQGIQACAQSAKCSIVMGVDGQILVNQG